MRERENVISTKFAQSHNSCGELVRLYRLIIVGCSSNVNNSSFNLATAFDWPVRTFPHTVYWKRVIKFERPKQRVALALGNKSL